MSSVRLGGRCGALGGVGEGGREQHRVERVDPAAGDLLEGGQERRVESARTGRRAGRARRPTRRSTSAATTMCAGERDHAGLAVRRRRDDGDAEIRGREDAVFDPAQNVSQSCHHEPLWRRPPGGDGCPRRTRRRRRMRKPQLVRADGLPERVTIYEVGPRDGLQNESAIVDVAVKAEFIRRLVEAGPDDRRDDELRASEVGSAARRRGRAARRSSTCRPVCGRRCWCRTSAVSIARSRPAYGRSRSSPVPPRRSRRRT